MAAATVSHRRAQRCGDTRCRCARAARQHRRWRQCRACLSICVRVALQRKNESAKFNLGRRVHICFCALYRTVYGALSLWCGAMWCGAVPAVPYGAVVYGALPFGAMRCRATRRAAAQCLRIRSSSRSAAACRLPRNTPGTTSEIIPPIGPSHALR